MIACKKKGYENPKISVSQLNESAAIVCLFGDSLVMYYVVFKGWLQAPTPHTYAAKQCVFITCCAGDTNPYYLGPLDSLFRGTDPDRIRLSLLAFLGKGRIS